MVALVALAVCAVGIVMAATASAAMTLPEFKTKTSWTGTSGAGALKASGVEIACTKGSNSGSLTSGNAGTFSIKFEKCSSSITGTECNSEGDAAGIVLVNGSWNLVLTTISSVDKHLVWFLVTEFKAKCGTVTITTKGNVLGEITPANTSTKSYVLKEELNGTTQEYTTFENDSGTAVSASLLSEAALGFHAATEKSAENALTTAAVTEIVN
jgi:hypothetical protein